MRADCRLYFLNAAGLFAKLSFLVLILATQFANASERGSDQFLGKNEAQWHSPGHYANLTIDDPWFAESYGHLTYNGLLGEMEKANFHTTIAFIPWNYDRSEGFLAGKASARPRGGYYSGNRANGEVQRTHWS